MNKDRRKRSEKKIGERIGEKLGERLGERLGENFIKYREDILEVMKNNPAVIISQLSDKGGHWKVVKLQTT